MTSAFVDTTILTDVLLKPGEKRMIAKDALKHAYFFNSPAPTPIANLPKGSQK